MRSTKWAAERWVHRWLPRAILGLMVLVGATPAAPRDPLAAAAEAMAEARRDLEATQEKAQAEEAAYLKAAADFEAAQRVALAVPDPFPEEREAAARLRSLQNERLVAAESKRAALDARIDAERARITSFEDRRNGALQAAVTTRARRLLIHERYLKALVDLGLAEATLQARTRAYLRAAEEAPPPFVYWARLGRADVHGWDHDVYWEAASSGEAVTQLDAERRELARRLAELTKENQELFRVVHQGRQGRAKYIEVMQEKAEVLRDNAADYAHAKYAGVVLPALVEAVAAILAVYRGDLSELLEKGEALMSNPKAQKVFGELVMDLEAKALANEFPEAEEAVERFGDALQSKQAEFTKRMVAAGVDVVVGDGVEEVTGRAVLPSARALIHKLPTDARSVTKILGGTLKSEYAEFAKQFPAEFLYSALTTALKAAIAAYCKKLELEAELEFFQALNEHTVAQQFVDQSFRADRPFKEQLEANLTLAHQALARLATLRRPRRRKVDADRLAVLDESYGKDGGGARVELKAFVRMSAALTAAPRVRLGRFSVPVEPSAGLPGTDFEGKVVVDLDASGGCTDLPLVVALAEDEAAWTTLDADPSTPASYDFGSREWVDAEPSAREDRQFLLKVRAVSDPLKTLAEYRQEVLDFVVRTDKRLDVGAAVAETHRRLREAGVGRARTEYADTWGKWIGYDWSLRSDGPRKYLRRHSDALTAWRQRLLDAGCQRLEVTNYLAKGMQTLRQEMARLEQVYLEDWYAWTIKRGLAWDRYDKARAEYDAMPNPSHALPAKQYAKAEAKVAQAQALVKKWYAKAESYGQASWAPVKALSADLLATPAFLDPEAYAASTSGRSAGPSAPAPSAR